MSDFKGVRERLATFVGACDADPSAYRLTPLAEATPFARCFAVFLLQLLRDPALSVMAEPLSLAIVRDLKAARSRPDVDIRAKAFRQLLAFSLSALAVLPGASPCLLDELVVEQLSDRGVEDLESLGCLDGRAGSGNQAMFIAIFLLHGRDLLGLDTQSLIDAWVDAHLRFMNRLGFWGNEVRMTHLQFQNGYHQHEVLEHLGVDNPRREQTLAAVRDLADSEGHFAPYPGGGGCYDYDAVFMLTPEGRVPNDATRALLLRTAASIIAEQQPDGGFAESLRVRPRSLTNLHMSVTHTLDAFGKGPLFFERLRYCQMCIRDRVSGSGLPLLSWRFVPGYS